MHGICMDAALKFDQLTELVGLLSMAHTPLVSSNKNNFSFKDLQEILIFQKIPAMS